jgi:apolipoprotein N-acyltransferase
MTYLLALALGALYCIGFAPFDFWLSTAVAIGGLFWLLHVSHAKPWLTAFCFGVGKYAVGASWVYVSIHVYGNAPPVLAGLLVAVFVATLSLLFVLPLGWLYSRLRPGVPWAQMDVFVFVAVWGLLDWFSTWAFTGFPWLLPGYAFMQAGTQGLAPLVGVLGLGVFWVYLSAGSLAFLRCRSRLQGLLILLSLGIAIGSGSLSWVDAGPVKSVALVQGNIDQLTKWLPKEALPNVQKHLQLSDDHWDADVLIWPEAAITLFPHQAQGVLEQLSDRGQATRTDVVLGIPGLQPLGGGRYDIQNLAVGLGTARGRFAKHHLVPFGEYVPLEGALRGLISFFDLPMSSSSPGPALQPNLVLSSGEAAVAICYEVAYPGSMRRRAARAGLLITLSNDTWFGRSIGPLQHMQIAQMRALENGRWLLRATNNGVTAIVNPEGEIAAQLPQFEANVLRGDVQIMNGRTPYNRIGDGPLLFLLTGLLVGALISRFNAGRRT